MARVALYCIVLLACVGAFSLPAIAQTAITASAPATDLPGPADPNPLPGLPRPPEQPASLFQPAPAAETYANSDLESPYFERDPLLDRTKWSQPGWLFDAELDVLGSHVFNHVGQFVSPTPIPVPFVVSVPMAPLNWTTSPRFELGYRLPSGFGELDVAYRFLDASGNGPTTDPVAAPDGTATLTSHLHIDLVDLDYAAHETSLGPTWDMKWRIGVRSADALFDSRADELPALAAPPGSGFYERTISNTFWGIGPHAAVELRRQCNDCGLGLVGRLDGALLFGRVRQTFTETSTANVVNSYNLSNLEQVPILSGFLGLDWRPPRFPSLDLQLGYTGEYWWNVGRLSDPDMYNSQTAGEIGLNGAVFRMEYNY